MAFFPEFGVGKRTFFKLSLLNDFNNPGHKI